MPILGMGAPGLVMGDTGSSPLGLKTQAYRGRVGAAVPAGHTIPGAAGGKKPYTYTITDVPVGLAIDASTLALTGSPTGVAAAGEVTISVTDADAHTVSAMFDFPIVAAATDLTLDDWDHLGYNAPALVTDFLALIESDTDVGTSGTEDIWARPPRGNAGAKIDDPREDYGLSPSMTMPNRIRLSNGARNFLLNHSGLDVDGNQADLAFSAWVVGPGADLSAYFQTTTGMIEVPVADRSGAGGGFLAWNGLTSAQTDFFRTLDTGVRFIWAFATAS